MKAKKSKPRLGIILDYTLRIPEFKECYTKFKEQVLVGMSSAGEEIELNKKSAKNNAFADLQKKDPAAYDFYVKTPIPASNFGADFDLTFKKYFFSDDHRLKFLSEWSYGLFGQGAVTNKADINLINVAQTKLCDIILIDRADYTRKIPNTFAFLSRAGLFIKELRFINQEDEIDSLKKELVACWDPFTDAKQIIEPGAKYGQHTQAFLDFLMEAEKLM